MQKINLQKPLLDLDDQPILDNLKPIILSKAIAGLLLQGQSDDPLKIKSICSRLHKAGEIELDESDYELFKNAVKKCQFATDMLRGSILEEMAKQKK